MLTLRAHAPPGFTPPPHVDGPEEAVRRAYSAASDAHATAPCGFYRLGPQLAPLLAPFQTSETKAREWVLVTCPSQSDYRGRCLTAAQRFMLSLSWDGLQNAWVDADLPDGDAFRAAGVDLGSSVPVGLIWWGTK